jgi:fructosamine-3-kinase
MTAEKDPEKEFQYIAEENSFEISDITELGGGDINEVFLITTASGEKIVVKLNNAENFPGMYEAEKTGLETLAKTQTVDIPKVLGLGNVGNKSYLLLEYKSTGKAGGDFWENFATRLAALHRNTSEKFGFSENNYIGSLPQQNTWMNGAAEFYISQRLEPQLKLAKDQNFDLGISDHFLRNISENIPDEPPALIHGDLWNGNLVITAEGNACLIDPAVAYAPREMDLAMMKLFGGFDPKIFRAYDEEFPLERGFEERIPLWQLYYLLVHLNIFGAGYKSRVANIVKRYN